MRSTQQKLNAELQLSYREYFESKLAKELLQYPQLFPAVKKISTAIVKLMLANQEMVIAAISNNSKIISDLKEPFFGACYGSDEIINPLQAYQNILYLLAADNIPLQNVMQVHCIFIYRIYTQLSTVDNNNEWNNKIFQCSIFNVKNRTRRKMQDEEINLTTQLGISNHPVFNKKLGQTDQKHLRAKDKFKIDHQLGFYKSALEKTMPIVCGTSRHTGFLLLGAKLYGNLSSDELKEYAYAIFAFLTAGGQHSFYEIMLVAGLVIDGLQADNYSANLPLSIRDTEMYQQLEKQFPEFLGMDCQSEPPKMAMGL